MVPQAVCRLDVVRAASCQTFDETGSGGGGEGGGGNGEDGGSGGAEGGGGGRPKETGTDTLMKTRRLHP